MISTLLFEGRTSWATCNAGMMVVNSFFLIIVEMKQLGLVTWFMTFKEVVLLMVHHFAKYVIAPPFVLIYVQLVCIAQAREFDLNNYSFRYA